MKPIQLHYTEALIRSAVKGFWWRKTGYGYFIAFFLLTAFFAYSIWSGDRSWWVGVCGAVLGMSVILKVVLYFVHYRGSLGRFRRMREPEAMLELSEERFRLISDVGASELAWSTVTALWRFPDFWLLFVSSAQFVTLPTADLDPVAREFIIAKLKSRAVKVS